MKKIFLFMALVVLFVFSYSALAEPARKGQPIVATSVQHSKAGTLNLYQNMGYTSQTGQTRRKREKAKKDKIKIFENHTPDISNNMAYG